MKCDLYYIDNIVSSEEAGHIREKLENLVLDTQFTDNPADTLKTSSVNNCYLGQLAGLLDNAIDVALNCNKELYGFDLFQPNVYDVVHHNVYCAGQEYDWHIDAAKSEPYDIKLTLIIDVSADSYTGGQFNFFKNGSTSVDQFVPNSMIIFPSYMPHKVEPVISGKRESISLFLTGPNWK